MCVWYFWLVLSYLNLLLVITLKILIDAGIVNSVRSGLWTRYSINEEAFDEFVKFLPELYKTKDECICAQIKYCRLDEHEQDA